MPQQDDALITKVEINGEVLDPFYLAAVECVEEAVVNAIVAGEDVATVKPAGLVCRGIDTARLSQIFSQAG
jgi:D-aminopeptidase